MVRACTNPFALFHTPTGLRLTPSYDQVAASLYKYKTIALAMGGASNMRINDIKAKNVYAMAAEFGLPKEVVKMLCKQLNHHRDAAKEAVFSAHVGSSAFKDKLIKLMETRWNGTFALIG
jgi:serine/threonine-protein kinase HipA